MKCETLQPVNEQIRKYRPCSDFLISKSDLPRLLVEVNSTSTHSWPLDLVQMLLMGAAVVRFANKFLNAFRDGKSFVLCALYVRADGVATRFTLFQDGQKVCSVLYINELAG